MTARGSYRGTEEKQARILQAAFEIFANGGYDAASVRSIAAAAGMSHPGVLHHFPTKQALLEAVLLAHDRTEEAAFRELWTSPTVETFAEAIAATVALDQQTPALNRLRARLAAAGSDPQHPAHSFAETRYQRLSGQIHANLHRLHEAGELTTTLSTSDAADILLGLLDGLGARWLCHPQLDTPRLVREAVLQLLNPDQ
ncbi:MAG: helix-turn-helix domain-containing protein [Actinomycetia bacterium]|nr:helix-turn-helix domain-containing protein [Actinomycetes bacterium]